MSDMIRSSQNTNPVIPQQSGTIPKTLAEQNFGLTTQPNRPYLYETSQMNRY